MSAISRETQQATATIADNAQTSDAIKFKGMAGGGFRLPAGFVGTAMTFEVSDDNDTFVELEGSDGNAVTLVVQASKAYALPAGLLGWPYFKLKSGSSETGGPLSIPVVMHG